MSSDRLIIFDTTMRDGEQSPGATMTREEKLRIARQLERMRVDVMEAGFPAASNGDFEAVHSVASIIRESTVCGLSRANEADIRRCAEAIAPAPRRRIHTFLATSRIHMEKKLRMEPSQVLETAVNAVRFARGFTDDVEFSPEDAGRSDIDFLCRVLEAVIKAGATTLNIPDTVGYTMPEQYGALIRTLLERVLVPMLESVLLLLPLLLRLLLLLLLLPVAQCNCQQSFDFLFPFYPRTCLFYTPTLSLPLCPSLPLSSQSLSLSLSFTRLLPPFLPHTHARCLVQAHLPGLTKTVLPQSVAAANVLPLLI